MSAEQTLVLNHLLATRPWPRCGALVKFHDLVSAAFIIAVKVPASGGGRADCAKTGRDRHRQSVSQRTTGRNCNSSSSSSLIIMRLFITHWTLAIIFLKMDDE